MRSAVGRVRLFVRRVPGTHEVCTRSTIGGERRDTDEELSRNYELAGVNGRFCEEAYVKALGTGIAAHPLSGFDVRFIRREVSGVVSSGETAAGAEPEPGAGAGAEAEPGAEALEDEHGWTTLGNSGGGGGDWGEVVGRLGEASASGGVDEITLTERSAAAAAAAAPAARNLVGEASSVGVAL